jgi:hypothetical protein
MRFLPSAAFVLGLLLLGYALAGLVRNHAVLTGADEVPGTITALTPLPGGGMAPTVRFSPAPGSISNWITRTPLPDAAVGQPLTLIVAHGTGQVIRVGSLAGVFGPLAATGVLGLVLVAFGASAARRFSRGQRPWA